MFDLLSLSTARLLAALYTTDTGGLTAAELAGRLQISPASVSKAVAFLECQGLVRRERGHNDRRAHRDPYPADRA